MNTTSSSFPTYKGHTTFRNQPSYKFFNKSFEDPTDSLFLGLNEIHPFYLQAEQLADDKAFENNVLVDPRTKQEVKQIICDHTRELSPKIYRSNNKSVLTKAQHLLGLQVLLAWQDRTTIDNINVSMWHVLDQERSEEKQKWHKFVYDYWQAHMEYIYAPTKKLVELYKKWYKRIVEELLTNEQDVAFNTHTGLPHVRVCNPNEKRDVEITEVQLLELRGYVALLEGENKSMDCKKMHFKVESFGDYYNNGMKAKENILKGAITHNIEKDDHEVECHKYFIPLESLLFLLTAGDYPDLPTEMLLEIKGNSNGDNCKIITFKKPLPARNCGWHTHKQMVEQAFTAYLSVPGNCKWQHVEGVGKVTPVKNVVVNEIDACEKQQNEYKALKFEEYLENYQTASKSEAENQLRFNEALLQWQLNISETNEALQIYTTLEAPPALNDTATKFYGCYCLKLEYKPEFGCELLTKFELLQAWLQMRLMSGAFPLSDYGKCLRISVKTFQTQLEEHLTLEKLEQYLTEVYSVNVPQLIANLREFLSLLSNMPTGKYLLRYNLKFKDKFMLCSPSHEITKNTIFLHALLKTEPSELLFMTEKLFLPTSDHLCSIMHRCHSVLPSAFLPMLPHQLRQKSKKNTKPARVINDLDFVMKQVKRKLDQKKANSNSNPALKKRKKLRRRQRLKLKKDEQKRILEEEQELNEDIQKDKILLGF